MLNFKNMATVSMLNNPSISSSHMLPTPHFVLHKTTGRRFLPAPCLRFSRGMPA